MPSKAKPAWLPMPGFLNPLSALPFPAFLECVACLLNALGYTDVRRMGRVHWRQRTAHGGLDLQACAHTGVTRTGVLIQVKQYDRPVHRRFVDELRGAMLRLGAGQGLLMTTSTFSPAARRAAAGDRMAPNAPVRLVEGEELLDWMLAYEVGVRKNSASRWRLDEAFFARLRGQYPGRKAKRSSFRQIAVEPQEKLEQSRRLSGTGQDTLLFQIRLGRLTLTLSRATGPEE